jgi:DMSO/TMAO reductase YedYZ molybdopterin-dependent catalytic subunit
VRWEGVPFSKMAKLVKIKPEAKHAMIRADFNYLYNVPLADLMRPTTLFALKHNGEPLPAGHAYPLRLVVPRLYVWKSVRWVRAVEFMADETSGFWDDSGYHI